MTGSETVLWGVIAGIVTAILLGVFKSWFSRVLVPWFEDHRYKSVRISGEWNGVNTTKDFDVSYRLSLNQKAGHVDGVLRIGKQSKGAEPSETLVFSVEGIVWEGFLSFTTKSTDDARLAFGSDLYQIKGGGDKLDGIHLYRSLRRDCVSQIPLVLTRT